MGVPTNVSGSRCLEFLPSTNTEFAICRLIPESRGLTESVNTCVDFQKTVRVDTRESSCGGSAIKLPSLPVPGQERGRNVERPDFPLPAHRVAAKAVKRDLCTSGSISSKSTFFDWLVAIRITITREYHSTFGAEYSFSTVLVCVNVSR